MASDVGGCVRTRVEGLSNSSRGLEEAKVRGENPTKLTVYMATPIVARAIATVMPPPCYAVA